jgi:hypothetical protein
MPACVLDCDPLNGPGWCLRGEWCGRDGSARFDPLLATRIGGVALGRLLTATSVFADQGELAYTSKVGAAISLLSRVTAMPEVAGDSLCPVNVYFRIRHRNVNKNLTTVIDTDNF